MKRSASPWTKRFLMLAIVLSTALFATAADRDRPVRDGMFIATTGRIVSIDFKNQMLRVRGSGIRIATVSLDEYTVLVTNKTLIQDGGESITLEDFSKGETISIHGTISGNTLTASRLSKWS